MNKYEDLLKQLERKTEVIGEKIVPVRLFPPQVPHEMV